MANYRQYKKRLKQQGEWTTRTARQKEIYNENLKLASQVNRRLKGLEQAGYKGSWASKKLINRIDTKLLKAWTKGGRVKVSKNLKTGQQISINRALKQFLSSKTSKASGIKSTKESVIKSLQQTLSDDQGNKVDEEDAEFYYDMFGDDDFDYFEERLGASTLWTLIHNSIEAGDDEDSWIARLGRYIEINDEDIRNRAIRLYYKYIA